MKDRPWINQQNIPSARWRCAYCNSDAASNIGYVVNGVGAYIRICGNCSGPTFFAPDGDYAPGAVPGEPVEHVPSDLASLFNEARAAAGAGAYTAAVLTCRKILMHIAVEVGDKPGKTFLDYVNYLASNGYIPPNGKGWVDYIRTRGNEANHEIVIMGKDDALSLLTFVQMLLRFIYELPKLVPVAPAPPASP